MPSLSRVPVVLAIVSQSDLEPMITPTSGCGRGVRGAPSRCDSRAAFTFPRELDRAAVRMRFPTYASKQGNHIRVRTRGLCRTVARGSLQCGISATGGAWEVGHARRTLHRESV